MKDMIALELGVVRLLAAEARAARARPRQRPDPRPPPRRALHVDRGRGGRRVHQGAGWIVEHRPEWLRAAGRGQRVRRRRHDGRRPAACTRSRSPRRASSVYRIHVHGTWGHGSMPREDNAAVLAAEASPASRPRAEPRLTPVMGRFLEATRRRAAASPPPRCSAGCSTTILRRPRPPPAVVRPDVRPDPARPRPRHDQPRRRPRRHQVQRDPRRGDDRDRLPRAARHDRGRCAARSSRTPRPELVAACEIEHVIFGAPAESPADHPLFELLGATVREHDPDGVPVPVMVPFATDAKHTARLGVPTYGFSPCGWTPANASSSASTASTSASASTRCAGASRSCTTSCAASAADAWSLERRRRLDPRRAIRAPLRRTPCRRRSGRWPIRARDRWMPGRGRRPPSRPTSHPNGGAATAARGPPLKLEHLISLDAISNASAARWYRPRRVPRAAA